MNKDIIEDIANGFQENISEYCKRNSIIITRIKQFSNLGIEITRVSKEDSEGNFDITLNLKIVDDFQNYNNGIRGLKIFSLLKKHSDLLEEIGALTFHMFASLSKSKYDGQYGSGDGARNSVVLELRDYFKIIEILRLERYKSIKQEGE